MDDASANVNAGLAKVSAHSSNVVVVARGEYAALLQMRSAAGRLLSAMVELGIREADLRAALGAVERATTKEGK